MIGSHLILLVVGDETGALDVVGDDEASLMNERSLHHHEATLYYYLFQPLIIILFITGSGDIGRKPPVTTHMAGARLFRGVSPRGAWGMHNSDTNMAIYSLFLDLTYRGATPCPPMHPP